jgi:hypothetical protein
VSEFDYLMKSTSKMPAYLLLAAEELDAAIIFS